MDEPVEKYRPAQRLFDHVENAKYGHLFPYPELQTIIGKDPQGVGRTIIHRVRRRLLREKQKLLLPLDGQGYYIAHPDEHVSYAETMSEAGNRKKEKALAATIFVDASAMDANALRRLVDQQVKLRIQIVTQRKIDSVKVPDKQSVKLPSGEELLGIITARRKKDG